MYSINTSKFTEEECAAISGEDSWECSSGKEKGACGTKTKNHPSAWECGASEL